MPGCSAWWTPRSEWTPCLPAVRGRRSPPAAPCRPFPVDIQASRARPACTPARLPVVRRVGPGFAVGRCLLRRMSPGPPALRPLPPPFSPQRAVLSHGVAAAAAPTVAVADAGLPGNQCLVAGAVHGGTAAVHTVPHRTRREAPLPQQGGPGARRGAWPVGRAADGGSSGAGGGRQAAEKRGSGARPTLAVAAGWAAKGTLPFHRAVAAGCLLLLLLGLVCGSCCVRCAWLTLMRPACLGWALQPWTCLARTARLSTKASCRRLTVWSAQAEGIRAVVSYSLCKAFRCQLVAVVHVESWMLVEIVHVEFALQKIGTSSKRVL